MSPPATSATLATAAPRAGERWAMVMLFAGAITIAFSGLFVRWSETGPVATGFYRMGIAGFALLVLPFLVPPSRPYIMARTTRRDRLLLLAGGLLFGADLASWHPALMLTTISNATFIGNTSTIFVALGAWLILRRRIGWMFVLGMAVTVAGAAGLMGASFALDRSRLLGDGLSLLAAMFYGGYFLIVAEVRARLPTFTVIMWTSLTASVVLLPLAALKGEVLLPQTLAGIWPLLGIGLLVHVAGQGAIAYAFAHLSPQFTALGTYLQPVASAVLAWLLLGERLGPGEIAGSAAILAGIWIAHAGSRRDAIAEGA
ncbi:MAG: DMT family transporter [Rhodospirillaceae bacterium]|nr:DMT family transporter [Rhodospirillaceae bacterium]